MTAVSRLSVGVPISRLSSPTLITVIGWNDDYIERIQNDTGRSLMGPRQENWLYRHLSDSANRGTTWRVIGSQLRFSRLEQELDGEVTVNLDSWDVWHHLPARNALYILMLVTGLSRTLQPYTQALIRQQHRQQHHARRRHAHELGKRPRLDRRKVLRQRYRRGCRWCRVRRNSSVQRGVRRYHQQRRS